MTSSAMVLVWWATTSRLSQQQQSVLQGRQRRSQLVGLRATRGSSGEQSSSSGEQAEEEPSSAELELWETRRSIARALFTPVLQARQNKVRKLADKIKKKREAAAGEEEFCPAGFEGLERPHCG